MFDQLIPNLHYSWSLELAGIIRTDDVVVSWLAATVEDLVADGVGSVEAHTNGVASWYFVDVPPGYLNSPSDDGDVLVLELTRIDDDLTLTHVRPAWSGSEPLMDEVYEEAGS